MKFFLCFFILLTFSFADFNATTYDSKSEKILKAFDIEPNFLNTQYLFRINNSFLSEIRQKQSLEKFQNAYHFIPTLKEMFLRANIPQEFLYLAMIESDFSLSARSSKSAVGMWQFTAKTAKSLGLTINAQIDERKDFIKSTQAAITYLKFLKKRFGKWYLAAIAYNCGEGRLRKAIKNAGTDSLEVLLDSSAKYIPLESRIYIQNILSMSLLFNDITTLKTNNYDHFLNRGAASLITSIEVPPATSLQKIAAQAGLSFRELKQYNPHFIKNTTPTKARLYTIYLPYKFLATYQEKNQDLQKISFLIHRVNRGDTLSSIAKQYGVSSKKIIRYNTIKNAHSISINQEIIIPLEKDNV